MVLDGGGQFEDVGRSREDADRAVAMALDEPLAGGCENSGVYEPPTDQDVRPGAGLGDRGLG
ncbi:MULTISPECIES: hypothetical protein [unclassified Streptomyces]|uniref:hypothetical protein n=1 Tax=unclassified Streptomyces TaxID=2593676 RepID=UPI0008DCD8D0|nr:MULTISPECIES: hypothetical protein [unclassified Streptomyces]OII62896.1 hypothetical protein BJP39_10310 [Streptomyces sp. CC77]